MSALSKLSVNLRAIIPGNQWFPYLSSLIYLAGGAVATVVESTTSRRFCSPWLFI
jgi:hypothetical protein